MPDEKKQTTAVQEALHRYADENDGLLTADGLDEAIIGIGRRCGQPDVVVYSIPKAILWDRKLQNGSIPSPISPHDWRTSLRVVRSTVHRGSIPAGCVRLADSGKRRRLR